MRFFRVNLPRKYLCEDHADELIQTACSMKVFYQIRKPTFSFYRFIFFKINVKKLKQYEKHYFIQRAEEEEKETPLQRLEVDKNSF
jgi:hypothetical protein